MENIKNIEKELYLERGKIMPFLNQVLSKYMKLYSHCSTEYYNYVKYCNEKGINEPNTEPISYYYDKILYVEKTNEENRHYYSDIFDNNDYLTFIVENDSYKEYIYVPLKFISLNGIKLLDQEIEKRESEIKNWNKIKKDKKKEKSIENKKKQFLKLKKELEEANANI